MFPEIVTEMCTSEKTDQPEQQQQPQKFAHIGHATLEKKQDQQQPRPMLKPPEKVTI